MTPKVSIITAVHNDGEYLPELAKALQEQTLTDFEWIIVDDYSSDPTTLEQLELVTQSLPRVTVLRQAAQAGPGAAYRRAAEVATGEYILPVDADDKIADFYLERAAQVLDENPEVGVVYGIGQMFGKHEVFNELFNFGLPPAPTGTSNFYYRWTLPDYSFPEILAINMLFASAMFRRADYLETVGYSADIQAFQDYALWVAFTELAVKRGLAPNKFFYRLPDVVYYWRQRVNSHGRISGREGFIKTCTAIFHKHTALYEANIEIVFDRMLFLQGFISNLGQNQAQTT